VAGALPIERNDTPCIGVSWERLDAMSRWKKQEHKKNGTVEICVACGRLYTSTVVFQCQFFFPPSPTSEPIEEEALEGVENELSACFVPFLQTKAHNHLQQTLETKTLDTVFGGCHAKRSR